MDTDRCGSETHRFCAPLSSSDATLHGIDCPKGSPNSRERSLLVSHPPIVNFASDISSFCIAGLVFGMSSSLLVAACRGEVGMVDEQASRL